MGEPPTLAELLNEAEYHAQARAVGPWIRTLRAAWTYWPQSFPTTLYVPAAFRELLAVSGDSNIGPGPVFRGTPIEVAP